MNRIAAKIVHTVATLATLALLAPAALAADWSAAPLAAPPPKDVAEKVRAAIAETGVEVKDASGKPYLQLWLAREAAVVPGFSPSLTIQYPLVHGALVGVAKVVGEKGSPDFRKQGIKPGIYTVRYGHQPEDGNHLGTAPFRDFLLLCPVEADASPATIAKPDDLFKLSTKAAKSKHPAVFYLAPPQKRAKLPAVIHDEANEFRVLCVAGRAAGGKELALELVVSGHSAE